LKIVEFSNLSGTLAKQIAVLNWLGGDPPHDAGDMRRWRKLGYPTSEYQALFAVEAGQVLSKVETTVQPYRTPAGTEPSVWVSGVVSRPDALRRGFARALFQEMHARERSAGRRWAFLWTHHSWVAHRLYETLGYRDVYTPPSALVRVPKKAPRKIPPGYRWTRALASQAELLEEVLAKASRGRLGFIPRFPGSFRARFELGFRTASNNWLLWRGSRAVGYAYVVSSGRHARGASEVVVTHPRHAPAMIAGLEGNAAGQWLALARTTFITDHEAMLRKSGFDIYHHSHATLMAKPLRVNARRPRSADPLRVCRSAQFMLNAGDIF
jgi:GNAT superfamily N-acetyltransferase